MHEKLAAAIDIVRTASRLTKSIQKQRTTFVFEKKDHSPVTLADYASQLLIASLLQEQFPEIPLMAEENLQELQSGDPALLDLINSLLVQVKPDFSMQQVIDRDALIRRGYPAEECWVLDPIDGTKGFLRGEQFAIALALLKQGEPVLGVVGCPNLDRRANADTEGGGVVAYAVRAAGAWIIPGDGSLSPVRLLVSDCADPAQARFVTSAESSHSNQDLILVLKSTLKNPLEIETFDSQAKYVMVAAGRSDLFLRLPPSRQPDYHEKVWDHAAGSLIVIEAGGMVTDIFGKPFDFTTGSALDNNYGLVVSNGRIHAQVTDYFGSVLPTKN